MKVGDLVTCNTHSFGVVIKKYRKQSGGGMRIRIAWNNGNVVSYSKPYTDILEVVSESR